MQRLLLPLLAFAAATLAAASAPAQGRDAENFQSLTVLQVDLTRNEIRVREPGSARTRTVVFDDRTQISEGTRGGSVDLRRLQPGDTIRVPGAVGGVSDRMRAEQIQVLTTSQAPGAMSTRGLELREESEPDAVDPTREPGALGSDPSPRALGRDRRSDPGTTGADPGASDQGRRGTGSQSGTRSDAGTEGGPSSPGPGSAVSGSGSGGTGGSGSGGGGP